ncbi:hypothetical protein [Desulfobacula sp.]|nr:hypothetical protein [Desulfobacula sp.]
MEKIGVGVSLSKTGKNKDMGSWFIEQTKEEESADGSEKITGALL